jgi:acetyltransferase-like isoleucine patch superfamily enzyme
MYRQAANLLEKVYLTVLRKKQFTSQRLRKHFRDRYQIDVGLYSYGCFDRWRMPGPIRVGRYCSFANTVRSAPINHLMDAITTHPVLYERQFGVVDQDISWSDPLVIEDDVWIGHFVMILPSCKFIGRGAVIGAGAIVTRDVEPYAIVAGNPARKLRSRFEPDLIASLEASRWWELDPPELRKMQAEQPETLFHPSTKSLSEWTEKRHK